MKQSMKQKIRASVIIVCQEIIKNKIKLSDGERMSMIVTKMGLSTGTLNKIYVNHAGKIINAVGIIE